MPSPTFGDGRWVLFADPPAPACWGSRVQLTLWSELCWQKIFLFFPL